MRATNISAQFASSTDAQVAREFRAIYGGIYLYPQAWGDVGPGWSAKEEDPKPIAPFDNDPVEALAGAFDRLTGEPVMPEQLKK